MSDAHLSAVLGFKVCGNVKGEHARQLVHAWRKLADNGLLCAEQAVETNLFTVEYFAMLMDAITLAFIDNADDEQLWTEAQAHLPTATTELLTALRVEDATASRSHYLRYLQQDVPHLLRQLRSLNNRYGLGLMSTDLIEGMNYHLKVAFERSAAFLILWTGSLRGVGASTAAAARWCCRCTSGRSLPASWRWYWRGGHAKPV